MVRTKHEPMRLEDMTPRVGIIGAMDVEVDDLMEELEAVRPLVLGPTEAWLGEIASVPVAVVHSGVGKSAAAAVAQALISLVPLKALINTGVAGALSPRLSVEDVVVSKSALYHDVDASAIGYPAGKVPGFPRSFHASRRLVKALMRASKEDTEVETFEGAVTSGDVFVNDPAERSRIHELTGALCCDMEGAAIAQVAFMNNLPFVICRAISDDAKGTSPLAYARFEPVAAHSMAKRLIRALPAVERAL